MRHVRYLDRIRALNAALICVGCLPTLLDAQGGAVVKGRVTNQITGEGIAGIRVDFRSGSNIHATTTDKSGTYTLENFTEGEYTATFSDLTDQLFPTLSGTPHGPIKIPATGAVRIDTELAPPGKLRGRVIDEDGNPVHIEVGIDHLSRQSLGDEENTDDDGKFSLTMRGGFHMVSLVNDESGAPLPEVSSSTGFVLVRAGSEVDGYEIRVAHPRSHLVRGIVIGQANKPVPGVNVLLSRARTAVQSAGGVGFSIPQTDGVTKSGEDGTFQFDSVSEGDWRFQVLTETAGKALRGTAYATVYSDLRDVRIQLAESFSLERHAGLAKQPSPVSVLSRCERRLDFDGRASLGYPSAE